MKQLLTLSVLLLLPALASAQSLASARQTLYLEVRPVALIEVSGDPQPILITNGQAGNLALNAAEERSTSYRLTTNATDMKLAVSIDEPVPTGTRLYVEMEGANGSSVGKIDISDALSPVDAVTGIGKGNASDQNIVYTFEADADRDALSPQTRRVFLTLTN